VDVNEHERLSNFTQTHIKLKEQRFYCCSRSTIHYRNWVETVFDHLSNITKI